MSQKKNSLNKKLKRLALFFFNSFCICTLLVFAARIRGGCAPKSHYTPKPHYTPKTQVDNRQNFFKDLSRELGRQNRNYLYTRNEDEEDDKE